LNVGGYGAAASNEIHDPTQRAGKLKSLPHAMPTEAITNEHSFAALGAQSYYQMKTPLIGDAITMGRLGGPAAAADRAGQMDAHGFLRREQGMVADRDTAAAGGNTTGTMLYEQARSADERSAGRAAGDRNDWELTSATASYGSLAEKASLLKNRALDDIKNSGNISDYTQQNIDDLNSIAEGRMAFLNSPAVTSNLNAEEKANTKKWFNDNGYAVEQLGSQVRMDFALDSNDRVVPSGINTFEGHKGSAGFNLSESYGHSMDMAITPDNQLVASQNGTPISFVGGRRTI